MMENKYTVKQYWRKFRKKNNVDQNIEFDSWSFGDGTPEMADKLAQLVVTGKKTATSSSLISYTYEEERMPVVNQYDVVLDGFDQPVAIIQYTKIEIMPIKEVSNLFASLEGEGDLSLSYWYNVHKKFFTAELEAWGKQFSDELLIACQTFKVVG